MNFLAFTLTLTGCVVAFMALRVSQQLTEFALRITPQRSPLSLHAKGRKRGAWILTDLTLELL